MRAFRVFIFLIIFAVILFGTVYFYFNQLYPPNSIRQLGIAWISEQLKKPVEIESGFFNLFRGFQLDNVIVYQNSSTKEDIFLKIDRLKLNYSWKSLLRNRLEISQIVLDRPAIFFSDMEFFQQQNDLNIETVRPEKEEPLPLEILINNLEINNATIEYKSTKSQDVFIFNLSQFFINVKDIKLAGIQQEFLFNELQFFFTANIKNGRIEIDYRPADLFWADSLQVAGLKFKTFCDFEIQSRKIPDQQFSNQDDSDSLSIFGGLILSETECRLDFVEKNQKSSTFQLPVIKFDWNSRISPDLVYANADLGLSVENMTTFTMFGKYENSTTKKISLYSDSIVVILKPIFDNLARLNSGEPFFISNLDIQGQTRFDSLLIFAENKNDNWDWMYRFRNEIQGVNYYDPQQDIKISGLSGFIQNEGKFVKNSYLSGSLKADLSADSLIVFEKTAQTFSAQDLIFRLKLELRDNFFPESFSADLEAQNIFGGTLISSVNLLCKEQQSLKKLNFQNITGEGDFLLKNIDVEKIFGNSFSGSSDLNININSALNGQSVLIAELKSENLSVEFESDAGFELLPDIDIVLDGKLSATDGFETIFFKDGELGLNDLVTSKVDAQYSLHSGEANLYFEEMELNLPMFEDYFPAYLRDEMISTLWMGKALISSEISTWSEENGEITTQIIGDIHIKNEIFDNPFWSLRLDSLDLEGIFGGNFKELQLDLEGKLGEFQILETTPKFFNTEIYATISVLDWNQLHIQSLDVDNPDLGFTLTGEGTIENLKTDPVFNLSGSVKSSSDSSVKFLNKIWLDGSWTSQYSIFSVEQNPAILQLSGWIEIDSLDLIIENGLALRNIRGRLPISQLYDLNTGYLFIIPQKERQILKFKLFEIYESYFFNQNASYSFVSIDSMIYENYRADNIKMFLDYDQGSLFVPKLSMNLYDGNLNMRAKVNFNTGALADIQYDMQGQLSRVNSSILPGVIQQEEEQSRIGVSYNFKGKGLNLSSKVDLEGTLEVTEIGSRATQNLLNSIDPSGTDSSVRSVKKMINLGYKPYSISFQIRHGYFYPAIFFSQPWYSPIKIAGGQVSISRLPVKFILDLMAAEKKLTMQK